MAKSKNPTNLSKIIDANVKATRFLTFKTRVIFTQLRQAFTKALILWYFDPEYHIRIETDASIYAIGEVLSRLILNNLGPWYLVVYFSRKMITAKIRYETHNDELLAIIEGFKTWCHYLEGCKYKVLVHTDHNNLCQFIDIKSLSSCQVWWAQKISRYHFQIDYCQKKGNRAANVLSCFP